jgi:hypothetical protein
MGTILELGRVEIKRREHARNGAIARELVEDPARPQKSAQPSINGVLIGVLVGYTELGLPLIDFVGNRSGTALPARSTTPLTEKNLGGEVVLAFEAGNLIKPIILGCVQIQTTQAQMPSVKVSLDGVQMVLTAEQELVLRCGKASITLTRAGKVLIHGEYVLNASAGVNRIRGGTVQIN